jgi:hypothetical protein
MQVNQQLGMGNIKTTVKKNVGNEESIGVKVQGKDGKEAADIQDLVDM